MSDTILICGVGPGISSAVARKFGQAGFSVALVARTESALEHAVAELAKDGIRAAAFAADVRNSNAIAGLVQRVRESFGQVTC